MGESCAHPTLGAQQPFAAYCHIQQGLSLGITVGNEGFGNQEVEEDDMKQNQDFSVLCFCLFVF